MITRNPKELKEILGKRKRMLGIDVGSKTLGLAMSDVMLTIATPYTVLVRKKFRKDAETLNNLIEKQGIGGLVIGLPLNMDGSEGPRCQSTRQFGVNIQNQINIPITFWDERLSTVAVTRTLLEANTSRAKRSKVVDSMAAAFILQGYHIEMTADF